MSIYKTLKRKIKEKKAVITVAGLGYVGLPIALGFSRKGFMVYGLDTDRARVQQLKKNRSYINDISSSEIAAATTSGMFVPTEDTNALNRADAVIICVPTPLGKTHKPDLSFIIKISKTMKDKIRHGQLVIFESTTYPGTTREVILPILQRSGLKLGDDFFLAFSPERIDPGNPKFNFRNIPKVIGGCTKEGTELGEMLYSNVIKQVVSVSSTDAAEVTKLLENTFRIVNIGLINEFASLCNKLGIDVWEVINAAATKPFGFMPFYPGPGIGGHCIPADPIYLSWKARKVGFETKMIDLAAQVNRNVPKHIVERIEGILGRSVSGAKIMLLGVAYKKDVNDLRDSPALDIMEILIRKKAEVVYHDPFIPEVSIKGSCRQSVKLDKKTLKAQDMAVVVTDHTDVDYRLVVRDSGIIFDTRNIFARLKIKSDNIVRL
ncbi:MAG: nucleotide sugar dehydrogenase [Candidatus Omnitrophica bacterium]|nr:nucleotide sugar dehydrogenase [Candidatus Omnitrophota bacterium]